MKKRLFIIHGWGGYPDEGWLPWLGNQLRDKNFTVSAPAMPNTQNPIQEEWVSHMQKEVGDPDGNCYFVGHSLGCITILRYLESLDAKIHIGGCILVAGFDNDLSIPELANFFKTPIDWDKIKSHTTNFISIESDNDPYDLAKYNAVFKDKLKAKTILEHNKKHFSENDGIVELQIVLTELLQISS